MTAIRKCFLLLAIVAAGVVFSHAATFGKVIPIGGHAADIALDELRGRLYVANFTANRIEVISTVDNTRLAPIIVRPQPGAIALSPDGRYLVIGHYARWDPPVPIQPSVTVLDMVSGTSQVIPRNNSPLAIAFGGGNRALIAYGPPPHRPEEDRLPAPFELFDPATGSFTQLALDIVDTKNLPVPFATFPPEILKASAGVSGDGQMIYTVVQTRDEEGKEHPLIVRYRVADQNLALLGVKSEPDLGPRAVSVNQDGSTFLTGWTLLNSRFVLLAQFPYPTGRLNLGSHALDYSRNLIYANLATPEETSPTPGTLPAPGQDGPVLTILDSDNLTVRERIRLPESLAGKSLLSSDKQTMYSVSDSGVMVLPIGALDQTHRITTLQEDLFFPSSSADPSPMSLDLELVNPGGGTTRFRLSTTALGVRIIPETGVTPARVRVEVDPASFLGERGTTAVSIQVESSEAINIPFPVRVLVNTRDPEQVGTMVNVPGKLVDILADPVRDRFYILRQDKNRVLVFHGSTFQQIAEFRTGNTPTQMALTRDGKYLIVGNDNSQIANVYDLDLLLPSQFIEFPGGHYPRSIAVSNNAILATARVAGLCFSKAAGYFVDIPHCMDEIDFATRTAARLPSLGIYLNDIRQDAVLTASPSGEYILLTMPDGTLALYEALADSFVASRKDFTGLSGAYAALSDRLFSAGNEVVNWSLVPITQLESDTGLSSGLIFSEGFALRTTSPSPTAPGVIQRVNLSTFQGVRPVRMAESPLLAGSLPTAPIGQIGQTILPFLRTLAPLPNGVSIVSLSISGFTVLPRNFDAFVPGSDSQPGPAPVIDRVVNLADGEAGVAPGGLIVITGSNFSTETFTAVGTPLPNTLGGVAVTASDRPVPLLSVSPNQIVAQLPFNSIGATLLRARTAAGPSNLFSFTILAGAPAVFRTASAGPLTGLPAIYRAINNEPVTLSNPVHPEDELTIFLTGLGVTSPSVEAGAASPADPLAAATFTPLVTLGGVPLPIRFAGLVPGYVGLYQINALVPGSVPGGLEIPLTIRQGSYATTLTVRVVK